MTTFALPEDLRFNHGPVEDPSAYARASGCSSWLLLTGEEFAGMPGGISFEQVRAACSPSRNIPSDPPRVLDLGLARAHVEALDELPRPTLITCRAGPRASAVAYMYAGLRLGAEPDAVIAAAESEGAPFCHVEEYRDWVRTCIERFR